MQISLGLHVLLTRYSILSVVILLIATIVGLLVSPDCSGKIAVFISKSKEGFDFDFNVLFYLLVNNFTVAILLSLGGYFTGGVLSVLVLFWNGFNLGCYLSTYNCTGLSIFEFSKYFIFHGIPEFFSFVLFATIGFSGIKLYKNLLKNQEVKVHLDYRNFIAPSAILATAALVEGYLISNY